MIDGCISIFEAPDYQLKWLVRIDIDYSSRHRHTPAGCNLPRLRNSLFQFVCGDERRMIQYARNHVVATGVTRQPCSRHAGYHQLRINSTTPLVQELCSLDVITLSTVVLKAMSLNTKQLTYIYVNLRAEWFLSPNY